MPEDDEDEDEDGWPYAKPAAAWPGWIAYVFVASVLLMLGYVILRSGWL